MADIDRVTWIGNHQFSVHRYTDTWNEVADVYIFCGPNQQNQWFALYVGQAESLAARIPGHERWREAAQLGATHVHALVVHEAAARDNLEAVLVRTFQPRLNSQHR
jgi:predicted GIY-YIG superfamily endonuclease